MAKKEVETPATIAPLPEQMDLMPEVAQAKAEDQATRATPKRRKPPLTMQQWKAVADEFLELRLRLQNLNAMMADYLPATQAAPVESALRLLDSAIFRLDHAAYGQIGPDYRSVFFRGKESAPEDESEDDGIPS